MLKLFTGMLKSSSKPDTLASSGNSDILGRNSIHTGVALADSPILASKKSDNLFTLTVISTSVSVPFKGNLFISLDFQIKIVF